MRSRIENVLACLSRLVRLYAELLTAERQIIDCYLEGRLDDADRNRASQERLVGEVRTTNWMLQEELSDETLGEFLTSLPPSDRLPVESELGRLRRTTAEVSAVIRQNRRYVQNSAAFCQGILQRTFAGTDTYNGYGTLQASRGTRREGMRA